MSVFFRVLEAESKILLPPGFLVALPMDWVTRKDVMDDCQRASIV